MAINPFLEERLPIGIKMGATYGDDYNVEITKTRGGSEYRHLNHPYPVREYSIGYIGKNTDLWQNILGLYHRAYGMYAGFRVNAMDDFSTNAHVNAPTAFDQTAALVSAGIYQLQKAYGSGGTPLSIGLPVRTIFKPVASTTLVGVNGVAIRAADWSVDTATGLVTFAADVTTAVAITAVSKANPCVITYASAPPFVSGQAVHLSSFGGMTQLNNQRSLVTVSGNNVTLTGINSLAYTTWTSLGTLHTRPQSGESVTCGCYFDIPFRFNSRIDLTHESADVRDAPNIDIIELINL